MLARVERVEGREPVKRLESSCREPNFVIPPRKEGMGPTKELAPRVIELRPVRVERVDGREPVKPAL
jgi:hypothetical protein